MTTKNWFVILQQSEIEILQTPTQIAVFSAIKSYSGNGKKKVGLSLRDIASRCKVSAEGVRSIVPKLVKLRLVKITGKEGRRGGQVPMYQVSTQLTVNYSKCQPSGQLNKSSVNWPTPSVKLSGTKYRQSKKVNNTKVFRETEPTTEIEQIFSSYKEKINPNSRLLKTAREKVTTRLKEWSLEDLLKAIANFSKDWWWMEHNAHRGIRWFFDTDDRVEQFINLKPRQKQGETYRPVEELL